MLDLIDTSPGTQQYGPCQHELRHVDLDWNVPAKQAINVKFHKVIFYKDIADLSVHLFDFADTA